MKGLEASVEILDERCMRVMVDVGKSVKWKAGQWVWIGEHPKGLSEWCVGDCRPS